MSFFPQNIKPMKEATPSCFSYVPPLFVDQKLDQIRVKFHSVMSVICIMRKLLCYKTRSYTKFWLLQILHSLFHFPQNTKPMKEATPGCFSYVPL